MAKFWLVWKKGDRSPSMMHATEKAAEAEAKRLAEINPNELFYVLETRSVTYGKVQISFTSLI